jgi:hypothetical protein
LEEDEIKKSGQIILVRKDSMFRIPFLKSEVIQKLLYGIYFTGGHKKTGERKVNKLKSTGIDIK